MNLIAVYRQRLGLSQKSLGAILGCSQSCVANYETGYREVGLKEARAIVHALNAAGRLCVSLDDVFPPDPPRPPKILLSPDVGLLDKFSYGADFSFVNQEASS